MKHLSGFVLLFSLIILGGCASTTDTIPAHGIKHIVLVWLNNAGDQQDRSTLIKHSEELRSIPGLIDLQIGTTVLSDRKIGMRECNLNCVNACR
ncbi:hypothetical protein [Endozoicomonas atrinae]|uniref:hypothetical protein n=1 Tax=Endozoicomonas atrinae TaxID=1333660 RepID=UPI00082426BE|nr:hypothetical protein [Endozoicomonas atrinae]